MGSYLSFNSSIQETENTTLQNILKEELNKEHEYMTKKANELEQELQEQLYLGHIYYTKEQLFTLFTILEYNNFLSEL